MVYLIPVAVLLPVYACMVPAFDIFENQGRVWRFLQRLVPLYGLRILAFSQTALAVAYAIVTVGTSCHPAEQGE